MAYEHTKIQKTLKILMKKKKATYQTLGYALKVSSATIKRRLNGSGLTIEQATQIANALSVSFYELIELSKNNSRDPHLFTDEQENLLASDLKMILLFRFILAGKTFSEIQTHMKITEKVLRKYARELERVGLAQLLNNDRLIPVVRFPVKWRAGGMLHKAYDHILIKNLFQRINSTKGATTAFNQQFELALSPESYNAFQDELRRVYLKYRSLSELYLDAPIDLSYLVSGVLFVDQFSIWDTCENSLCI